MTFLPKSLLAGFSLLLASCSLLAAPAASVNEEKPAQATLLNNITTQELYGAWAMVEDEPAELFYMVVLTPNHVGFNYMTIDEKNGKPESRYSEYYTWTFDEASKIFTSITHQRKTVEHGQPEKVQELNEVTSYNTRLYQLNDKNKVVQFTADKQQFTFVKMEDEMYQRLVKDIPDLPPVR